MRTREELESRINGSTLFSIDRAANRDLFVEEERRFLNDLADFMSIFDKKVFNERGLEIIETAKSCIKSYNAERGDFLRYFDFALKRNLSITKAKERAVEYRGGLAGIDRQTERTIRKILKYTECREGDINDEKFQTKIAGVLGISLDDVYDAITANANAVTTSGNVPQSGDDNGLSLFDIVKDAKTDSPDEIAAKEDTARALISSIETAFSQQQNRTETNALLKKLMTALVLKAIHDIDTVKKVLAGATFLDVQIYEDYTASGRVPTNREIAQSCGMLAENADKAKVKSVDASISRTLKKFLKKIPQKR